MIYTKPELFLLADARTAIQHIDHQKDGADVEVNPRNEAAAYEADE